MPPEVYAKETTHEPLLSDYRPLAETPLRAITTCQKHVLKNYVPKKLYVPITQRAKTAEIVGLALLALYPCGKTVTAHKK
jgi:hypothetical protein